jgi:hypothetical protein
VFVEIGDDPEGRPQFFVVPELWIQADSDRAHAAYLERHGGHRARASESKHHSIETKRIEQWRDRWDLLEILEADD